jgi:hypothetical protein
MGDKPSVGGTSCGHERYGDVSSTMSDLITLKNKPTDEVVDQQIAIVYLIRAGKDAALREQWVSKAISYTEKALSLNSKDRDVAGVNVLQEALSFESSGDLSAAERCAYYQRAKKLLTDRIPLLQGEQLTRRVGPHNFELWTPIRHWQRLRARGISRGTHSDESSRFLVPSLSTLRMWARVMERIRLLELLFRRMPETLKRLAPTISPKLHKCLRCCPSWQRPWSQLQLLLDFATASCAACIGPISRAINSRSDARCGTR